MKKERSFVEDGRWVSVCGKRISLSFLDCDNYWVGLFGSLYWLRFVVPVPYFIAYIIMDLFIFHLEILDCVPYGFAASTLDSLRLSRNNI